MSIMALIPAKGNSARLPGKNLRLFADEPLVVRTIHQAQASKHELRIVVSTDSDEIAQVARQTAAEVLIRPASLAQADIPMLPVVCHALDYYRRYNGYQPLYVVLLQPTSPLRSVDDIDGAIDIMLGGSWDSVTTVCGETETGSVYVLRRHVLERGTFYGERVCRYQVSSEHSVDIDTEEDWQRAILRGEKDDNRGTEPGLVGGSEPGKADDTVGKRPRGRPRKDAALRR